MSIVDYHNIEELEHKDEPLAWQKHGLSYTATGYGKKIPKTRMVRLPNDRRWRRVYCCIYSNIGTCYVTQGKNWIVIK